MMRWMVRLVPVLAVTLGGLGAGAAEAAAASLRGSPAAMKQQNLVAKQHELAFYRTSADIHAAVARGELVELTGNEDYAVADFVRHPFVHDAVRVFVERLSAQYRAACGQQLVVTSAVRPSNGQPSNAHALSVHPAGMAVDLRVSDRAECRAWLEDALLTMERAGVLNGIREHHPPHYHVAVFPEPYLVYAAEQMAAEPPPVAAAPEPAVASDVGAAVMAAHPMVAEVRTAPLVRRVAAAAAVMMALAMPMGSQLLRTASRRAA
jgi:hypothetical protein